MELRTSLARDCAACGERVLLTARFAHAWTNRSGRRVSGVREVALCGCTSASPEARLLLALIAVEDGPDWANLPAFAELLDNWLRSVQAAPDPDALRSEEEQWHAGEL
ncbi:DUF6300 family protein [Streptomyces sp. MS19]|uniref:DUF6300 family protein n=1 Tax=Streptomyces sp. MS19 TaxID=3385972 RepID=UPI0039A2F639